MELAKIRFLYHKPQGERGIGKAIVAWTWFLGLFYNWKVLKYNYSHSEVWTPDEDGFFEFAETYCLGYVFSSTTRGDYDGVRFASAGRILDKHPERWDYIECEVDKARLEVAIEEAKKLVGKKYDYLGIFGFVNPLPVHSKDKWYCEEICNWFKYLCRLVKKISKRISPRRSAYNLSLNWGEPKPLRRPSK